jgi:hypothetical protein
MGPTCSEELELVRNASCRGPWIGRESHHGTALDPVRDELGDVPVQRQASELRLWRIRRKDFHLPLAQIVDQPVSAPAGL